MFRALGGGKVLCHKSVTAWLLAALQVAHSERYFERYVTGKGEAPWYLCAWCGSVLRREFKKARNNQTSLYPRILICRVLWNSFVLEFKLQLHVVLYHRKVKKSLLFVTINISKNVSLRCFQRAFLLNYTLKSTNNKAQIWCMWPEVLRRPPVFRHVSVACIPPPSGRERVHTESWNQWRPGFLCELSVPDDGGIYATETCRSEGDPLRTLGHIT